jgi:hypothetical protein
VSDTYGVTPADIAAELPGLFPGGFTVVTVPSLSAVASYIATADTIITLQVIDATGGIPALTDRAAPLARQFIIEWVKGKVIRTVYTGNDPSMLTQAIAPYVQMTAELATAIELMGSQATGTGDAAPRTSVAYVVPDRELIVQDDTLGYSSSYGRRAQF